MLTATNCAKEEPNVQKLENVHCTPKTLIQMPYTYSNIDRISVPSCPYYDECQRKKWLNQMKTICRQHKIMDLQDKKNWRQSIVAAYGHQEAGSFFLEEGSFFQAVGSDCFENVLRYLLSHGGGKGLWLLSVNWWRILASFVSLSFTSLSSTLVSFSSDFCQTSPFWLPLSWMSIPSVS